MAKATWNGLVLAESDKFELVEGNVYFPPSSVKMEYFNKTDRQTVCPWKGTASYYTIKGNGKEIQNAAWYYPAPKSAAASIKDHVAFYGMVTVEK